jgi:hypothetical protein
LVAEAIAALVLLIRRRHRMVLVLGVPIAIDAANVDGQPIPDLQVPVSPG